LLTYIVIGAAVLAALIALRDVRITLTNRRVARDLVPGVRKLRKLASESRQLTGRCAPTSRSPTSSSPSSMRRSRS